jgi:threonine/homoserine/homoserine lactone efflux protein
MIFKAFALGLIVAIPVGPIAILIFRRSIDVGYRAGVASGIGAALADGLFAFLATLGVAVLAEGIEEAIVWVRPIGGVILIILGAHFFFKKSPQLKTEEVLTERYLHHYTWDAFSTFLLTLTNPMTVLAFAALFAGISLIPEDPRNILYLEITMGVFFGSLLWWLMIVLLSHQIKQVISAHTIHRLMQILALILVGLGIGAIIFGVTKI